MVSFNIKEGGLFYEVERKSYREVVYSTLTTGAVQYLYILKYPIEVQMFSDIGRLLQKTYFRCAGYKQTKHSRNLFTPYPA